MVQDLILAVEFGYIGSRFDEMAIRQGIFSETSGFNDADLQNSIWDQNLNDESFDF